MNDSILSDIEIELLLLGKWRFDNSWEKITIQFKDDMTYEQTKIQTFILSKPKELVTGTKFTGIWYVSEKTMYLSVKAAPKSILNLHIPLVFKISIADMIASLGSIFLVENYKIIEMNNSKFLMTNKERSIVGTKIK